MRRALITAALFLVLVVALVPAPAAEGHLNRSAVHAARDHPLERLYVVRRRLTCPRQALPPFAGEVEAGHRERAPSAHDAVDGAGTARAAPRTITNGRRS